MSSSVESPWAIQAQGLGKCYHIYAHPRDRLKQFFACKQRQYYQEFWSLRDINLQIAHGEVVGVVGKNGAGKSTLLQLLCGTLQPSTGELQVNGRIAALLELGAGFNPDFTGRENVYMNAAILGLSREEIEQRLDDILAFADIGRFVDQPVKTYSSGMFVRLAFSVATSVDPDILIVDEALSVGDGAFARKSFDRIMKLRDGGKTILFCSHSLYQIEASCSRAIWLDQGSMRKDGSAQEVLADYAEFLEPPIHTQVGTEVQPAVDYPARLRQVEIIGSQEVDSEGFPLLDSESPLNIRIRFRADRSITPPTVGITILTASGITVTSALSCQDHMLWQTETSGDYAVTLTFPRCSLLKGRYGVSVFLLCENGTFVYDHVPYACYFRVRQHGLEQGYVSLPHHWSQ